MKSHFNRVSTMISISLPKVSAVLVSLSALAVANVSSAGNDPSTHSGRASFYSSLEDNSLEHVTTSDALATELRYQNVAPTRIWKLLEHGEKVECLDCIPVVSKLLYDSNAKTREISAWWLRRRIFGVFGPGEIYSRVVAGATDQSQSESRRAYAVNALGEFLNPAGVSPVAQALMGDDSAQVRVAAAAALERLNSEGPNGELGAALADPDENVRLAALHASISVNVFSATDSLVERFSDDSALVRRRTAEAAGAMRLSDAVVGLIRLSSEDMEPSADVRGAAVWALGQIGDGQASAAVQAASHDSSKLVRDAAHVAVLRLRLVK